MKLFLLAMLAVAAGALELTPDNWDSATAGKTTFIKFLAPWCGHCKKMKPDWDKLMAEYKDHATILIADVDCTTAGKPLCDSNGVKGFPTIKHGDVSALEDYQGGRDFASLKSFASKLKPLCSPSNMDLCDDEQKAEIEKVMKMSAADLDAAIAEGDKKMEDAEQTFNDELEKLQNAYKKLQENKENTIAEVKASGLSLLKSVKAFNKKGGKAKEEL